MYRLLRKRYVPRSVETAQVGSAAAMLGRQSPASAIEASATIVATVFFVIMVAASLSNRGGIALLWSDSAAFISLSANSADLAHSKHWPSLFIEWLNNSRPGSHFLSEI